MSNLLLLLQGLGVPPGGFLFLNRRHMQGDKNDNEWDVLCSYSSKRIHTHSLENMHYLASLKG